MDPRTDSTVRVALITGGTSGIGRELATALAAEGYAVAVVGRREELLDETRAELSRRVPARAYRADLGDEHAVRELAQSVAGDFGRLDLLVHSAGRYLQGGVEDGSVEDLDAVYRTNVRAPFLLTQLLLPLLRTGQGQVVFVNSSAVLGPTRAQQAIYAASKHALRAIADGLRAEVNAHGVRVLSVYPGRTATPMQAEIYRMEGRRYHPERLLQAADVAAAIVGALRLPRTAELTEISIRPMLKDG